MSSGRPRRASALWPRSGWMRVALVVLAVVVALNVALLVIAEVLPSPSGPRSSSYATSARGFAALAELLENAGHPIRRVRELPGKAKLDPSGTVIVLDPDLLRRDEARALRDFVRRGGRLVAGGREPDSWVPTLLGWDPGWEGSSRRSWSRGGARARGEWRRARPQRGRGRVGRHRPGRGRRGRECGPLTAAQRGPWLGAGAAACRRLAAAEPSARAP